jgi:hypothetical protein
MKKRIYYDPKQGYVDEDGKPVSEETEPKKEEKTNEPAKTRK